MDSYIVRIYRRNESDPLSITGIVEKGGESVERYFHSINDLAEILRITALEADIEKRRTGRLKIRLPVMVEGISKLGYGFADLTVIKDLSSEGAYFMLKKQLKEGSELKLRIDPYISDLKMKASVVRVDKFKDQGGVGVRFNVGV